MKVIILLEWDNRDATPFASPGPSIIGVYATEDAAKKAIADRSGAADDGNFAYSTEEREVQQ